MRTLRACLCLLFLCIFLFPAATAYAQDENTVEVAVAGDLMALSAQLKSAYVKDRGYDFNYAFRYAAPILKGADLCIGNLETPVAGKDYGYTNGKSKNGYPWLNAPEAYLDAVKEAGFDVLGTANNHALDCGVQGVLNTLDAIEKKGMLSTGTYKTTETKNTPLITEVKGIKFAVLCYTQWTNSRDKKIPADKRYILNKLNITAVKNDIEKSKVNGADVVIVLVHWGSEGKTRSNASQKNMAKAIAAAGADIIIGSHPHVLQETAVLSTNTPYGAKSCFVAYSLGNFVGSMCATNNKDAAVLKFTVKKDGQGIIRIGKPDCIATYTTSFANKRFVVLPYYQAGGFTNSAAVLKSLNSSFKRTAKKLNANNINMVK